MIAVSANERKNNLFKYLDESTKGEKIIIRQDQKNIACLTRVSESDWGDKMTISPTIPVFHGKFIEPIHDTGSVASFAK